MAKIIVTFEDQKSGMVRVVCNPKLEQIIAAAQKRIKIAGADNFTPAEAYVFKAMHAVREASRRLDNLDPKNLKKLGELG